VVPVQAQLWFDGRHELGEGPVWLPRESVLAWVDILAGELHTASADGGRHRVRRFGTQLGAVALRAGGGLVLLVRDGYLLLDADWSVERQLPFPVPQPHGRGNDGTCSPEGRFLGGTIRDDEQHGGAALFTLEADHSARVLLPSVTNSNGLAFSADGRTLYYIDTGTRQVAAYDYDAATGGIGGRRVVVELTDGPVPDGMTIDTDGALWVAVNLGGAAVRRYAPTGQLLDVVQVPVPNPTSCVFGGPGLGTLYVTSMRKAMDAAALARYPTAGGVFRCQPGCRGLPPASYAG
jgi:sugar lactone lactonase YvrE